MQNAGRAVVQEDGEFWADASSSSIDAVWDNADDDVYGELLAS